MSGRTEPLQSGRHLRTRRRRRWRLWHRFVLLVGYAALLYGLVRGAVYLLVLLEGIL